MGEYIPLWAAKAASFRYMLPTGKESPPVVLVSSLKRMVMKDAVLREKGKWEEVEVSYIEDMYEKGNLPEAIVSMYCPICERYHNEVYWYGNPTEHINYCPNCGADMRGEIVEDTTSGCGRCDKCRINYTGTCRYGDENT